MCARLEQEHIITCHRAGIEGAGHHVRNLDNQKLFRRHRSERLKERHGITYTVLGSKKREPISRA
jgi:hypothetical protein